MEMQKWLNRGWELQKELSNKEVRLHFWKNIATSTSRDMTNIGHGKGGVNARIENAIIRAADLEREIEQDLENLQKVEEEIANYIVKAPLDEGEKAILEMRYVGHTKWEGIASELGYTKRWIFKQHDEILCKLNKFTTVHYKDS